MFLLKQVKQNVQMMDHLLEMERVASPIRLSYIGKNIFSLVLFRFYCVPKALFSLIFFYLIQFDIFSKTEQN